jgi:hypothetical protein
MPGSQEVNKQIRESLGLPQKPEQATTIPAEIHTMCDFPYFSYSTKRAGVNVLRIDYEDGSYFALDAPKGMPGPAFPGYIDVLLYYGQRDLFMQDYVEMSAYAILQSLGIETNNGGSYQNFYRDMVKAFAVIMETDRFVNPVTKERSHRKFFRILDTMDIAKSRKGISKFTFHKVFLESFRAGMIKRLDMEFCLWLDRDNKALARFLYAHVSKRLGGKSLYLRNLIGFLHDIGLGYIAGLAPTHRNQKIRQVLYPALNTIRGKAFSQWQTDDKGNIAFIP